MKGCTMQGKWYQKINSLYNKANVNVEKSVTFQLGHILEHRIATGSLNLFSTPLLLVF